MNKIKLIIRGGFDGQTPVTEKPVFRLVEGWNEAELMTPAGVLPAGLWGHVPAGDPYLLHASMLTTQAINYVKVRNPAGATPTTRTRFSWSGRPRAGSARRTPAPVAACGASSLVRSFVRRSRMPSRSPRRSA